MNETAMQTHVYLAHVDQEISCMFCDLRGVSVQEMTLHINSVHCSDHSFSDQEKTDLSTVYVSPSGNAEHCHAPLEQCKASTSVNLPQTTVANGTLQTSEGDRFVEYNCWYFAK